MYEERRLLYVGMTRARNHLYLVRADQRTTFGSFEISEPSRFLDDLPEGLIQRLSPRRHGRESYDSGSTRGYGRDRAQERSRRIQADARWETRPAVRPEPGRNGTSARPLPAQTEPPRPAAVVQQYQANMRVRHPSWGEGMVVDSRVLDGEELVDVLFESVGFKRLLASLAKLEKI